MKVLVTGAAGFIGHALTRSLCQRGDDVVGIDNLNHYYDVGLKQARLQQLETFKNFHFVNLDLADQVAIDIGARIFERITHPGLRRHIQHAVEAGLPEQPFQGNLVC